MFPHERSLVKKMEGKPFVLIGVNSDRDREAIKQVIKQEKITWRSFWNGGGTQGPISTEWGIRAWPTIYVLDAHGMIRYRVSRAEELEQAVELLLGELESQRAAVGG